MTLAFFRFFFYFSA
ncbi:pheST operon leader peptide PheM [Xenorhabdus nematophila]